jgi:hypothetical protein
LVARLGIDPRRDHNLAGERRNAPVHELNGADMAARCRFGIVL